MLTLALIVLWTVLGGLWRRVFGGWLGLPRWVTYVLMAPLTLPLWMAMPWDSLWPYEVMAGVAVTAACLLFFVVGLYPGGRYDHDREVLLKYGPFGIGYVVARRYWPDHWRLGGCIDGWSSVGEIALGASFWGGFGSVWVLI